MEPSLLIGDRLFVTKYSYGYSRHSFPFSPPIIKERLFSKTPKMGDVVVFKTTRDNRTDFIKRLIGLPGDRIQFINSNIYINNNEIPKSIISNSDVIYCGNRVKVNTFRELLPNGKTHKTAYYQNNSFQDSDVFIVPKKHYFFLNNITFNEAIQRDSLKWIFARGNRTGRSASQFFNNFCLENNITLK
jgi:signal peptidase I